MASSAEAYADVGETYASRKLFEKDVTNTLFLFERAAEAGHPIAPFNLRIINFGDTNYNRASKHRTITAKTGDKKLMKTSE